LINNYKKILVTLIPIIPHFSNEALEKINQNEQIFWPTYDESLLIEKVIPFVIQINGKKRGLIEVNRDITETELMKIVIEQSNIKKYLENKNIKKKIFIKNKLVNIII
jgi:leucyl-tRNA synthetase